MKYSNELKPVVQESFEIDCVEPDDITIPGNDTKQGILYFTSYMPEFRQTSVPAFVSREKVWRHNGKELKTVIHSYEFTGDYIDDYAGTITYCPICGRQLVENGKVTNNLRHIPIGDTYTTLVVNRRRLRCLNPACKYHLIAPEQG